MLSRPSLDEVLAYRDQVDEEIAELIRAENLDPDLRALVDLGIQHEQQHQELILTDLKHMLSCNPMRPAYQKNWPLTPIHPREQRWIGIRGGERQIGHAGDGFSFDNERPRHKVWIHDFEMASHPVNHGDFIEFIDDGGYRRPELWLSAGWDAVATRGWEAPLYWEQRGGRWHTFTLHGMAPVERNTPVCHVSFYEADAFARWAGARLPTEAEWEVADRKCAGRGQLPRERRPASARAARGDGPGRARAAFRRRVGVDAQRLRALPGLSPRRRAPSANTTASSCATSTCCAAARA